MYSFFVTGFGVAKFVLFVYLYGFVINGRHFIRRQPHVLIFNLKYDNLQIESGIESIRGQKWRV